MVLLIWLLVIAGLIVLWLNSDMFGSLPKKELLLRIQSSQNYREGKFQNLHHTPDLVEGVGFFKVMKDFFFNKDKNNVPPIALPTKKINLFNIGADEQVFVWFGHSSYFMQVDGKKILVDPVLSGSASPVPYNVKAFAGTDVYEVSDIPIIDFLFISHDHWDHLDYKTITKIQPTVRKVFCGLGVSAHLQKWGYDNSQIVEADWNVLMWEENGFSINSVPARHFSGRLFKRNQSLWMSYVLQTPSMKIFIGGDSGYNDHFKQIGEDFGEFDWAILECGQYHAYWKYIHMMPEEVVTAAKELKAKKMIPVHWAKFSLALHAWKDPAERVSAAAEKEGVEAYYPMIGDKLNLLAPEQTAKWWETV
ncbi:MAG: MBL fold metallo-hydrolase [Sediminibacterium sp.]|nr:MBL fold metallo-hydrolase [Sediminibacterium sp.]